MKIGPYEVLGELGRGGMGVVYRARHIELGREVALKVVLPDAAGDPELVARFRREASAAARLAGHPGIVPVHDVGEAFVASGATNALAHDARPVPYLAMDLVAGRPLDECIADGELTFRDSADLLAQAARAVHHAHLHGVLHRDLKPSNILVEFPRVPPSGPGAPAAGARELDSAHAAAATARSPAAVAEGELRARVADFGLARVQAVDGAVTRLTRSGYIVGTPTYMAPEQARGEPVDARADVYALGATLYEALTGRPPFEGDDIGQLVGRVLGELPPDPTTRDPAVPRALAAIAMRALAKAPAARYADAAAMAADLERFLGDQRVHAQGPGRLGPRGVVILVGVASLGGLAALLAVAMGGREAGPAAGGGASEVAADRAQGIAAAYHALAHEAGPALRDLEDAWWGVPGAPARVGAALARVRGVASAVGRASPETAVGPAWEALARAYAGEDAEARRDLARLAATAGDDPFPALFLARAEVARYVRGCALPGARRHGARTLLDPFVETAESAAARAAAERALVTVGTAAVWARLAQGPAFRAYLEGVGAFGRADYPGTVRGLGPLADDPLLGAEANVLRGFAAYLTADFATAAEAWAGPAQRGWPVARFDLSLAHLALGTAAGEDVATALRHLDAAEALCDGLLADGDTRRAIWVQRAAARRERGSLRVRAGQDAVPDLDGALADLDRVVASGEAGPRDRHARALAWRERGQVAAAARLDPRPAYARALADLDVAAAGMPGAAEPLVARAQLRRDLAAAEGGAGDLARAHLAAAEADLARAVTLAPDLCAAHDAWGSVCVDLADAAHTRGEDPRPGLEAAVRHYDVALGLPGATAVVRTNRAAAHVRRAVAAGATGEPPHAHLEAGLADFTAALAEAPADLETRGNRGYAHVLAAEALERGGGDPTAHYAAALVDLDDVLGADPAHRTARLNRAVAHHRVGDRLVDEGRDPGPHLAAAVADLDVAIAAAPAEPKLRVNRAGVHWSLAQARSREGADASRAVAAMLADCQAAIALDARVWLAHALAGEALLAQGHTAEAIAALEAAARLVPGNPAVAEKLREARRLAAR